jgi:hypothetical protein
MSLFEYLATASSLLYSIAALRILGGLPGALAPNRRYWLHLMLTVDMLLLITLSFWSFWSLRDVNWTFRGFTTALTIPGLLYYCAAVLVPENPEGVPSWRDHWSAAHRRWFGGFALWGIAAATSASVNLGMPLTHPARIIHASALIFGVSGAMIAKPRLHAVIVVALGILLLAGALDPDLDAGWLVPR